MRTSDAPTTGFRGFTLGLDVAERSSVDKLIDVAIDAGATQLKPAKKQLWGGHSGVVQAPNGTIWKVATTARRDDGTAAGTIERVVDRLLPSCPKGVRTASKINGVHCFASRAREPTPRCRRGPGPVCP